MAFDQTPRHYELFERVLRRRGCYYQQCGEAPKDGSEKARQSRTAHFRASIKMNGNDVANRGQNQQQEQWHVKDVPELEQAGEEMQAGSLLNGCEIGIEVRVNRGDAFGVFLRGPAFAKRAGRNDRVRLALDVRAALSRLWR
jgi:hypothetical protein